MSKYRAVIDWVKQNKAMALMGVVFVVLVTGFAWSYFRTEYEVENIYKVKPRVKFNHLYAVELLLKQQLLPQSLKQHSLKQPDKQTVNSKQSDQQTENKQTGNKPNQSFIYSQLDMDLSELVNALSGFKNKGNPNAMPTLLVNSINTGLSKAKYDAIMQWVEAGGHLITFNDRYDAVNAEEWQPVADLLTSANTSDKAVDKTVLDNALVDINANYNNNFLKYLNIYKIKTSSNEGFKTDEEIEQTKQEIEKVLQDIGIEMPLEQSDKDAEQDNPLVSRISNMIKRPTFSLFGHQTDTGVDYFLIKDTSKTHFDASVFYQKYPQAKPYQQYQTPDVSQIRAYLKQQKVLLQQTIKKFEHSQTSKSYLFLNYDSIKPRQAVLLINALLGLDDKQLKQVWAPMNHILLDSRFGQGRLTVLSDKRIFKNPDNYDIKAAKLYADVQAQPITLFSKQTTGLYDNDNAKFLVNLMSQADAVWLFPKVDIDALPVMLWKKAKLVVLGFLGLVFLWLYALYNRFGRMKKLPNDATRDIFKYFGQVGRYAWRVDNAKQLYHISQSQVLTLIHQKIAFDTDGSFNKTINKNAPKATAFLSKQALHEVHHDLRRRFSEKIQQIQEDESYHSHMDEQLFVENQPYFKNLLTLENLQSTLAKPDDNHINAAGFVMETQTLWLIKWLLK